MSEENKITVGRVTFGPGQSEVARLRAGVQFVNVEKHAAQADAEREKQVADTLRLTLAQKDAEITTLHAQVERLRDALKRISSAAARELAEPPGTEARCLGEVCTIAESTLSATPAECAREIREDQKRRDAEIARKAKMTDCFIGPLFGAGWNGAVEHIAVAIERGTHGNTEGATE